MISPCGVCTRSSSPMRMFLSARTARGCGRKRVVPDTGEADDEERTFEQFQHHCRSLIT
jgi:hypothetical protein